MQETTVFLSHFEDLPDYRQKGKVAYPLDEVLLVMLAAALAGAETVADIARFGQAKLSLLRRFRPFMNGTPSHDQLGIILAREDCGFIETADGRQIYFHRNAVLDAAFDRLKVGSEVAFAEEEGVKGPQASTVRVVGGHRRA